MFSCRSLWSPALHADMVTERRLSAAGRQGQLQRGNFSLLPSGLKSTLLIFIKAWGREEPRKSFHQVSLFPVSRDVLKSLLNSKSCALLFAQFLNVVFLDSAEACALSIVV